MCSPQTGSFPPWAAAPGVSRPTIYTEVGSHTWITPLTVSAALTTFTPFHSLPENDITGSLSTPDVLSSPITKTRILTLAYVDLPHPFPCSQIPGFHFLQRIVTCLCIPNK